MMFKMLYRQKTAPSINDLEETRSKYWKELLIIKDAAKEAFTAQNKISLDIKQRLISLNEELAKVTAESEVAALIQKRISDSEIEFDLSEELSRKILAADTADEARIITLICGIGEDIVKNKIDIIPEDMRKNFKSNLEKHFTEMAHIDNHDAEYKGASNKVMLESLARIDKVIDEQILYMRANIAALASEDGFLQSIDNLRQNLIDIESAAMAKVQIIRYIISFGQLVEKLKLELECMTKNSRLGPTSAKVKIKEFMLVYTQKILDVCKYLIDNNAELTATLELLVRNYINATEALYVCKSSSYKAMALLLEDIEQAQNENIKQQLIVQAKICDLQMLQKKLDVRLSFDVIVDEVNNPAKDDKLARLKPVIVDVIKKKLLYRPIINKLNDVLRTMCELNEVKEKMANPSGDESEAEKFISYKTSLLLLYSLQAFFLQCNLNASLDLEPFPKDVKKRISNLIANYKKFHAQTYTCESRMKVDFEIPSELLIEICAVNFLFKKSEIYNFAHFMRASKSKFKSKLVLI